ncbi:MAG TPA: thiamine pyrophosphate-binding protein [Terriglobales bacterium]|nr:thiamine pyrophosphate-binding protein [Terriglobales bacterium]
MTSADYIAAWLARKGITAVFELSGGMITHLLDSLGRAKQIRIVSMHHEQGAAFAADAFGRITGLPGIAFATSGPGATNLLTGIGSCYFDSSPAIFITGQVNRDEQKGARAIRQLGFQETDIVAMVQPIVKRAWRVREADHLTGILEEAWTLATSGRPGPVLVDIPMDIQRLDVGNDFALSPLPSPCASVARAQCAEIREAFAHAQRPLILAGGGIRSARAINAFRAFVTAAAIPVVHSLMGGDVLPAGHPLNVGLIGSYGNRWANLALHRSDCVLVLGSRLDVRQTGADTVGFKGTRPIFHVDCEPGEMNNRVVGCRAIVSDLATALPLLEAEFNASESTVHQSLHSWQAEIDELRRSWPDAMELDGVEGINPNTFMHQLSRASESAAAFAVDVGQHQMWAAQSLRLGPEQRFLTSGGMGSMGFGLPAAIGASVALPGQPVVVIAGDGGFQCNIQELQTVVRLGLPLKIVVLNNQCHGMVRQFQESYFEGRYQSTLWGYSAPDFSRVAQAYGIPSLTIEAPEQIPAAMHWLWSGNEPSAALLQVMIAPGANAYPKLAFGRGMDAMEPHVQPTAMEST